MAQQYRNQQGQENPRSRWREGNYGDRNEEDRSRDWGSRSSEQSGRRDFSDFSRGGESEQSGWGRDTDDDRWTRGGEGRYQSEEYGGGGERYGSGQQEYGSYGQSRQGSQGGYGRTQYGQREQGGYGGGQSSSRGRQGYGRQYESQSFDQPFPPGFQDNYGSSQRSTRFGSGREGSAGSGSHYGKGPKGYTRSDDRLKEVICEKLTDDPMIDASDISVEVTGQVVKLSGTVDDRSTKYEVEELIERCGGVKDIDNQLRVRSGSSQTSQMRSQGGATEATGGYGSGTGQTGNFASSQTSSQSTSSQSGKEGSSSSGGSRRTNS